LPYFRQSSDDITNQAEKFFPRISSYLPEVHILPVKRGKKAMRKVRYRLYHPKPPCRRPKADGPWKLLGCLFISAGLVLLFLCIPGWAWAALAGAALIGAGWALISSCGR